MPNPSLREQARSGDLLGIKTRVVMAINAGRVSQTYHARAQHGRDLSDKDRVSVIRDGTGDYVQDIHQLRFACRHFLPGIGECRGVYTITEVDGQDHVRIVTVFDESERGWGLRRNW